MRLHPYLIGIAGPSCSGKTEVARRVAANSNAVVLGLDSYYRDLSELSMERRVRVNFDAPESIDHDLLIEQLHRLASGYAIQKPVYDFQQYTRRRETEIVTPAEFIIVEGLFALNWSDIRKLLRTRIYIDAPHEVCYERRVLRDVQQRGRTAESVEQQYRETVQPMCERHVAPTMHFADLLLSGTDDLDRSAHRIAIHVEKQLTVKVPKARALAAFA